jgi:hypothetical protein
MGSKPAGYDDQAAAKLMLQLKAIATKEVAKIPPNCIDAFFQHESMGVGSTSLNARRRTVSVGSVDMEYSSFATPVLSCNPWAVVETNTFLLDDEGSKTSSIDHNDWSVGMLFSPTAVKKESSSSGDTDHPLLCSPTDIIKQCKKKRESFVGVTTKTGSVRATLRKKVSHATGNMLRVTQQHHFESTCAYPHDFVPLPHSLTSSLGSHTQRYVQRVEVHLLQHRLMHDLCSFFFV